MLSFSFVLFLCYLLCFIINIAAVYFSDRYFVSTNATSTFHSIVSSYPGRLILVTVQVSFYSYGSYVFFFRKQKGLCPYLLLYISKLKKSTQKVRSEEKRKKLVLSDKSVAILLFEGNNLLSQCRTRANSCKKLDLYFWIVGSTLLKSYHFLRSICSMALVL